jgi:hypothetical protein
MTSYSPFRRSNGRCLLEEFSRHLPIVTLGGGGGITKYSEYPVIRPAFELNTSYSKMDSIYLSWTTFTTRGTRCRRMVSSGLLRRVALVRTDESSRHATLFFCYGTGCWFMLLSFYFPCEKPHTYQTARKKLRQLVSSLRHDLYLVTHPVTCVCKDEHTYSLQ